jgi:hypothetical protein
MNYGGLMAPLLNKDVVIQRLYKVIHGYTKVIRGYTKRFLAFKHIFIRKISVKHDELCVEIIFSGPLVRVCSPLVVDFIILKINRKSMSTKGTLRYCKICDDQIAIKSTLWTIHWQRKHIDIQDAKYKYIVIDEIGEAVKDNIDPKETVD